MFVRLARPPGAADCDIDDVMVWACALPAVGGVHQHMFVVVGVSGQRDTVFAGFKNSKEPFAAWFDPRCGFDERNVHHGHNEPVLGHMFQVIFDECQLVFAEPCAVEFAIAFTHPVDVVNGDEVDRPVVERVVGRAVDAFPGFIAEFVVLRCVVDIVIAEHIVPRYTDMADGAVEAVEETEVIEQHISESDTEGGPDPRKFFNDVVSDVVDFFLVARLGVTEKDHIEGGGFFDGRKWKVDGRREWSGGRHAGKVLGGRAIGFVNVIETREIELVDHRAVARRFDHKDDCVVIHGD